MKSEMWTSFIPIIAMFVIFYIIIKFINGLKK